MIRSPRFSFRLAAAAALACLPSAPDPGPAVPPRRASRREWPSYGGDPGGSRFSPRGALTPENVGAPRGRVDLPHARLSRAAEGASPRRVREHADPRRRHALRLHAAEPRDRARPRDGRASAGASTRGVPLDGRYANQMSAAASRRGSTPAAPPARRAGARILTATNDARALRARRRDRRAAARTSARRRGRPRPAAGEQRWRGEYQVTSPPAVIGDVVVVGSAISDNQRRTRRAAWCARFDARTGALRWALRPGAAGPRAAPPRTRAPPATRSARRTPGRLSRSTRRATSCSCRPATRCPTTGAASAARWTTTGARCVALRGRTGELVWRFQTVHHDVWDYDVPAQPMLVDARAATARECPASCRRRRWGMLFVLHRETGEPLFPVEERPVPQGGVPGEALAPTQPFPTRPPPLVPHASRPTTPGASRGFDRGAAAKRSRRCARRIYTPPTTQGTCIVPGQRAAASNWGGVAVDPERGARRRERDGPACVVRLVPRAELRARRRARDRAATSSRRRRARPTRSRASRSSRRSALPCTSRPGARSPPWISTAARSSGSGRSARRRPAAGGDLLGGRHAEPRRAARHRRRPRVHRRRDGRLPAAPSTSRAATELWRGRLPGGRPGDADELRGRGPPVRGDRGGRPRARRASDRRLARGLRAPRAELGSRLRRGGSDGIC